MPQAISQQEGRDLLSFLSGEYAVPLCDGKAWLHCTELPGDTVSAAAMMDDALHVFVDLEKPGAYSHARQMLTEWLGLDDAGLCREVNYAIPLN